MDWHTIGGKAVSDKLDRIISPRLSQFGVVWRGDNNWVAAGSVAIRRVLRLLPLKGSRAVISWGYSLSFVPHISGTQLLYHKTFKSARLDVFDWPASYARSFSEATSFESIDLFTGRFESSLNEYFDAEIANVALWFERVRDLTGIEVELRRQIASASLAYRLHYPSPSYILPFVVAARGDIQEAEMLAQVGFTENAAPLVPKLKLSIQGASRQLAKMMSAEKR